MSSHVAARVPTRCNLSHLPDSEDQCCLRMSSYAPPQINFSRHEVVTHHPLLHPKKVEGSSRYAAVKLHRRSNLKELSITLLPCQGAKINLRRQLSHVYKNKGTHVGKMHCSLKLNPELEKLVNVRIPGQDGRPAVAAFVARSKKSPPGKLPVVIMIHEFYGLTEDLIGKAEALAEELGALVVAPDTYRGDWTQFIPKAIFLALSTPQERVNDDLDSVVAWVAQQPDADVTRLIMMGFCYGGGKAIRYSASRASAAATVVFYGSPLTDVEALSRLTGPVLLVYGDKDGQFPPAKVFAFRDALLAAGVEVQLSMFPGQGHAFFENMAQVKGDGPQRRAWEDLLTFLRRVLRDQST